MANEAIVFSMTSADFALAAQNQAGGDNIGVTDEDTGTVTASISVGLYALKADFNGDHGKAKLLAVLEQIKAKIVESAFPILP